MAVTIVSQVVVTEPADVNTASFSAPTGMAQDDLDLIILTIGSGLGSTFTTPSGYTLLWEDALTAGSFVGRWAAYWRLSPSSPASTSITWSSYGRRYVGGRFRITGHDLVAPINVTGGLASGGLAPDALISSSFNVAQVTTTEDNCLAIGAVAWMFGEAGGVPWTAPSGWTTTDLNDTASFNNPAPVMCAMTKTIASAGGTGAFAPMWAETETGSDTYSFGGRIIAIAPGPAPPPPPPGRRTATFIM